MTNKQFDFETNFVSVESQEKGSEFEVISDAGKKTGWFICLAGPDSVRRRKTSSRLQDFYLKSGIATSSTTPRNRRERRAAMSEDQYSGALADQLRQLRLDDMVAATISWRYPEGFDGPECTPENSRSTYEKHPTLFEQVGEAADDLDRFTKR
jgi:hypothetical protein